MENNTRANGRQTNLVEFGIIMQHFDGSIQTTLADWGLEFVNH